MAVKAGWQEALGNPDFYQWWDGKSWAEAFWPARLQSSAYLPDAPRIDISFPGEPSLDIVGENWREKEILAAVGRESTPRDMEFTGYGKAELVPEPDNPHDREAVSVRIAGFNVGYLEAGSGDYYRVVNRFVTNGYVPVVRVRIWGVTRFVRSRGQDELKSAIRVALAGADQILPDNDPPRAPHFLVPRGRSVSVSGEEAHFDVLRQYARPSSNVIVTLHPIDGRTKTSGTVLEVRLDGDRVGQLTPGMSASLMPLVTEARVQGRETAAWARVAGSHLAADITLRAARAEEIPESWPSPADTVLSIGTAVGQPPPAFQTQTQLTPPPSGAGIGVWLWALGIFAVLLLFAIPAVGWLVGLLALGGLIWWELAWRKRAPKSAWTRPA